MTDKTPAMPELPEPDYWSTRDDDTPLYTADQMRAYALAALQSAQPAEVSDEDIYAVWTQHCQTPGTTTRQLVCAFTRAILPLRPQAVPMPEPVQRLRRYAGQTMRTARNPNITAREAIEIGDYLAAIGITQRADGGEKQA